MPSLRMRAARLPPGLAEICCLAAFVLACPATAAPPNSPLPVTPNVVFIMLDDVGWGDPGAYGGGFVQTPRMDQLAAEGTRFTQYYANGPVCSPTRAALHTGHYPQEYGVRRIIPETSYRGIPPTVTSLPEMMGSHGYTSGLFGKWHLGRNQLEFMPIAQGYDESAVYIVEDAISYWDPLFIIDDQTEVQTTGHLTRITTDYALAFIQAHQATPFFMTVWYNAAHTPYEPTPATAALYPDTGDGRYAALITDADTQIGEIVDLVDSLGLGAQTLVMVSSDNGSSHDALGSNGPFRGEKKDVYEGGIRVPLFTRWTGTVPAGASNDSIALGFDLYATLATYLGVTSPTGGGIGPDPSLEGQSLLPALLNGTTLPRNDLLYWETKDANAPFPTLDGELNRFAVRDGDWKLVRQDNAINASPQLFDLSTDPYETTDVAASNPDKVTEYLWRYRLWRSQTGNFDYRVGTTVPPVVSNEDDFLFLGGRVELVRDARFDFNDGDFSFQAKITFLDLTVDAHQMVAEMPGSWQLSVLTNRHLRLVAHGPTSVTTLTSLEPLPYDREIDIAFTVFGWRGAPSMIRLYVEGKLQAETLEVDVVEESPSTIYLGNSLAMNAPFHGAIRHTRLYTMSLTREELLDDDFDDVGNAIDNCPQIYNPGQEDTDGDYVGDACNDEFDIDGDEWADVLDNCPFEPNPGQEDTDGSGIGDLCNDHLDTDGDEWEDGLDNCVLDPNPGQEDADGSGIGDLCNDHLDVDSDEWEDELDNCPDEYNPDQADYNYNGIGDACEAQVPMLPGPWLPALGLLMGGAAIGVLRRSAG